MRVYKSRWNLQQILWIDKLVSARYNVHKGRKKLTITSRQYHNVSAKTDFVINFVPQNVFEELQSNNQMWTLGEFTSHHSNTPIFRSRPQQFSSYWIQSRWRGEKDFHQRARATNHKNVPLLRISQFYMCWIAEMLKFSKLFFFTLCGKQFFRN